MYDWLVFSSHLSNISAWLFLLLSLQINIQNKLAGVIGMEPSVDWCIVAIVGKYIIYLYKL